MCHAVTHSLKSKQYWGLLVTLCARRFIHVTLNLLVTIYVEAILGLLLLFAWVQNTAIYAVAWWGFADLLRAASVALFGMYGSVPDLISIADVIPAAVKPTAKSAA